MSPAPLRPASTVCAAHAKASRENCLWSDLLIPLRTFLSSKLPPRGGAPPSPRPAPAPYRQHCCGSLQNAERLILRFHHERSEVAQRPPDRDRRQDNYAGRGFSLRHAKCQPDHNGSADKRDRIIFRANGKPPSEDRFAKQYQQEQK